METSDFSEIYYSTNEHIDPENKNRSIIVQNMDMVIKIDNDSTVQGLNFDSNNEDFLCESKNNIMSDSDICCNFNSFHLDNSNNDSGIYTNNLIKSNKIDKSFDMNLNLDMNNSIQDDIVNESYDEDISENVSLLNSDNSYITGDEYYTPDFNTNKMYNITTNTYIWKDIHCRKKSKLWAIINLIFSIIYIFYKMWFLFIYSLFSIIPIIYIPWSESYYNNNQILYDVRKRLIKGFFKWKNKEICTNNIYVLLKLYSNYPFSEAFSRLCYLIYYWNKHNIISNILFIIMIIIPIISGIMIWNYLKSIERLALTIPN